MIKFEFALYPFCVNLNRLNIAGINRVTKYLKDWTRRELQDELKQKLVEGHFR